MYYSYFQKLIVSIYEKLGRRFIVYTTLKLIQKRNIIIMHILLYVQNSKVVINFRM